MKTTNGKLFAATLDESEASRIIAIAEREQRSAASVIRQLVREALERRGGSKADRVVT